MSARPFRPAGGVSLVPWTGVRPYPLGGGRLVPSGHKPRV